MKTKEADLNFTNAFNIAYSLYKDKHDFITALDISDLLLDRDPDNFNLLMLAADCAYRIPDGDKTRKYAERLLKINPYLISTKLALAKIELIDKKYKTSYELAKEVFLEDPKNEKAVETMIESGKLCKKTPEIIKILQAELALSTDTSFITKKLGILNFEINKYEVAEKLLSSYLASHEKDTESMHIMSEILAIKQKYDLASDKITQAIACFQGKDVPIMFVERRAFYIWKAGNTNELSQSIIDVKAIHPNNVIMKLLEGVYNYQITEWHNYFNNAYFIGHDTYIEYEINLLKIIYYYYNNSAISFDMVLGMLGYFEKSCKIETTERKWLIENHQEFIHLTALFKELQPIVHKNCYSKSEAKAINQDYVIIGGNIAISLVSKTYNKKQTYIMPGANIDNVFFGERTCFNALLDSYLNSNPKDKIIFILDVDRFSAETPKECGEIIAQIIAIFGKKLPNITFSTIPALGKITKQKIKFIEDYNSVVTKFCSENKLQIIDFAEFAKKKPQILTEDGHYLLPEALKLGLKATK